MNKRHTSLDGLRGFAAFSVFLAHAGFNIAAFTSIPLVLAAYSTLAVGTNAVQILFVLSGFLMAYLYSEETHAFRFIRKRYTRIFPVFIVIITFLWLIGKDMVWYLQLLVLLIVAIVFHFGWKGVRKIDASGKIRFVLFWGFIVLQILSIGVISLIASKFVHVGQMMYPAPVIWLSNILLNTDIIRDMPRMLNQAWSLVPEMLFYLTFPFLSIPLIKLSKKGGILVTIIVIIGLTKIFFDLDTAMYSFLGLESMNIARASGFIAGIVIGIIYKSQGKLWQFLEKIFSRSITGILVFLLLLFIQWSVGDAIAKGNTSIAQLNMYYLASSWVIAFLIVAVIMPNTVMNKLFGYKAIAFFGVISYSVYLIHTSMQDISYSITVFLTPILRLGWISSLFNLFFALGLTIIVSYLLFRYIESLYFLDKKHLNNKALTKTVVEKQTKYTISGIRILWGGLSFSILIILIYSGSYTASLLVARNPLSVVSSNSEVMLSQKPLRIPFTGHYQNLSEIVLLLRYTNTSGITIDHIKKHRQLVFRIYTDKNKLITESKRDAYEVEGSLRFPFGFNPQQDSQDKKYRAEIFLTGLVNGEDILVNTSSSSFVSVYINKPESRIRLLPSIIQNRFLFAVTNPDALFALLFILFVCVLQLLSESITISSFPFKPAKIPARSKK